MLRRFKLLWLPVIKGEWDRLLVALCFIGFGIADFLTPDITNQSAFLELFRVAQFTMAGVLLFVGILNKNYVTRAIAGILTSTGLLSIAVIIVLGSESPTLFLIGAFGLYIFADLRRLRVRNVRESAEDLERIGRGSRRG